jgi:UDP-glucose:(heptosyl)LPS alpha-1,3-glucosyltransferase
VNVALAILRNDPARGGAERYTFDLAAALVRRGQDVTILCHESAGDVPGARVMTLGRGGGTRLGRYERFLDALDTQVRARHFDIVHAMLPVRACNVYHPHAGVAAEVVRGPSAKHRGALRQNIAGLLSRLNRKRQRFAAVERDLLAGPRPPAVLCLSELIKRSVRRHYAIAEARLVRLFNATDLEKFDPGARGDAGQQTRQRLGIGPDRLVALIIAQDFERKGLSEAIQATALLGDERMMLVVVGKQNPDRYRRQAERMGVGQRVIFAGATTDPYAFYKAADFFVLPTRHDPCSLVVLEALAMGLPVISTAQNGACEIMESGRHGVVLRDPADTTALAEGMKQMLDAQRRGEMAQACLELRPRLSYEHHLDELMLIYKRIAGKA